MKMASKQETEEYWKTDSSGFSSHYSKQGFIASFLKKRTNAVSKLVSGKGTVLDIGCGNGVHMESIFPKCESIVGVDISRQML